MLSKRVVSALVAIPLLLFFTIAGGIIFKIGIAFLSIVALYEYINAYRKTEFKVITYALVIGFVLYYTSIIMNEASFTLPILFLIVIICMATPIFNNKYNVISSAVTITGYIYIIIFFSFLILIRDKNNGNTLIWIVFIIAFCCDTFAYYTGRHFGKKKLSPKVSANKTVEGSIGGIIGSVLGVLIWGYFNRNIDFQWYQLIFLGVAGSIISQIGDLSASLVKRYIGLKDYGNIMPGHGGILDRFDSILFTAPVVYYYIVMFLG